jgi:hypothetical protein
MMMCHGTDDDQLTPLRLAPRSIPLSVSRPPSITASNPPPRPQDWGGLLGLRVVAAHAERFVRLVIANTFLPVCDDSFFQLPGGHFYGWKSACRRSQLADDSRMNVKVLMGRNGTAGPDGPISDAEAEAYNAPFPSDEYKAGARAFPELVPTPPTDPTGERPVSLHLRGLF